MPLTVRSPSIDSAAAPQGGIRLLCESIRLKKPYLGMGKEDSMPRKRVAEKAKQDLREGKSPTTAAGEFVHEEIKHVRQGKHGARSPQQAIAIGLSEARRAGIPVKPPKKGKTSESTRKKAQRDYEKGQSSSHTHAEKSTLRSRARKSALKKEPTSSASHSALSRHAKSAARRRQQSSR